MCTMTPVTGSIHDQYLYRPQRSCGQGYVFTRVCDSVHRGGGSASVHAEIPPPTGKEAPPGKEAPQEGDPPGKEAPREGSTCLPGEAPTQKEAPPQEGATPSPEGATP